MRFLGLDVGGSATRWRLISRDHNAKDSNKSGSADGFSGHLSRPEVLAKAELSLRAIVQDVGLVDRVVAGVSGLTQGSPEAQTLEDLLRGLFGAKSVVILSDIDLAHHAAFPVHDETAQAGFLVYAGTGSIAAHRNQHGILHTVGGKGVTLDDAGGGHWIAVAGLRTVLRAEDTASGSGWNSLLGQTLAKRIGSTEWPHVRKTFYALDRGGVGMLALAVSEAAHQGDTASLSILAAAGEELAGLAQMLAIRFGHSPVVLSGRASDLHPVIVERMQSVLPHLKVNRIELACADVAAEMAQRLHDFAKLKC